MRLSAPRRRGFTLTEIAIVVGVLGTIIAAIFAAASMAQYRVTLNQASDELNETAGNLRSLYSGRVTSFAALNAVHSLSSTPAAADYAYYMPIFIAAGIFPAEMVSIGSIVNNPWNSMAAAHTAEVALGGTAGSPVHFVVRYTNLTAEQCADLVVRNSQPGATANGNSLPNGGGLYQIKVNSNIVGAAGNTLLPLPVPPVNVTSNTACGSAAPYTVDWYYNLGN